MSHYLDYLENIRRKNGLLARESRQSADGKRLCIKDKLISKEDWAALKRHLPEDELIKSVSLQDALCADSLKKELQLFYAKNSGISEFYISNSYDSFVTRACEYICRYSVLREHLTLLKACLPDVFKRAAFCSWFILMIYHEANTSDDEIILLFAACLCHDMGLLYIDPKLVQHNVSGNSHSKKYYQHVDIAVKILKKLDGIPELLIRVVNEHHEHLDGTGHPRGLGSRALSLPGQYLHLLDSLFNIFTYQFEPRGKKLADTIPIIEMNSISHFGQTAKHIISIIKRSSRTDGVLIPARMLKVLIEDIKVRFVYIEFASDIAQEFTNSVGFRHDDKALFLLQNGFFHIALSVNKSPMLNSAYIRWLDHVQEYDIIREHHYIEVSYLTTNEVLYHIEKFTNQLILYRQHCKISRVIPFIESALQKLQSRPLPPSSPAR